jgi:hypothetical protein
LAGELLPKVDLYQLSEPAREDLTALIAEVLKEMVCSIGVGVSDEKDLEDYSLGRLVGCACCAALRRYAVCRDYLPIQFDNTGERSGLRPNGSILGRFARDEHRHRAGSHFDSVG